jgi:hypothetical protein
MSDVWSDTFACRIIPMLILSLLEFFAYHSLLFLPHSSIPQMAIAQSYVPFYTKARRNPFTLP